MKLICLDPGNVNSPKFYILIRHVWPYSPGQYFRHRYRHLNDLRQNYFPIIDKIFLKDCNSNFEFGLDLQSHSKVVHRISNESSCFRPRIWKEDKIFTSKYYLNVNLNMKIKLKASSNQFSSQNKRSRKKRSPLRLIGVFSRIAMVIFNLNIILRSFIEFYWFDFAMILTSICRSMAKSY